MHYQTRPTDFQLPLILVVIVLSDGYIHNWLTQKKEGKHEITHQYIFTPQGCRTCFIPPPNEFAPGLRM